MPLFAAAWAVRGRPLLDELSMVCGIGRFSIPQGSISDKMRRLWSIYANRALVTLRWSCGVTRCSRGRPCENGVVATRRPLLAVEKSQAQGQCSGEGAMIENPEDLESKSCYPYLLLERESQAEIK